MKTCSRCKVEQPINEFTRARRLKDGLSYWCRTCSRATQRASREAHPERKQQQNEQYRLRNREALRLKSSERFARRDPATWTETVRWQRIRAKYGITREQYEALVVSQNGQCAICGRVPERHLVVDHDHFCCPSRETCGRCLRGLLCSPCNLRLGWLERHWPQIARHATGKLGAA